MKAIVDHFSDKCFNIPIIGYAEIEKEEKLYCSDFAYQMKGSWKDNVLVSWKSNNSNVINTENTENETEYRLVPAELQMFFQFESNLSVLYSIIHSCQYKNEKASVLSVMWMKEYHGVPVSSFSLYKTDEECPSNNAEPLFQIIKCSSIHSHCLLMPLKKKLFCPTIYTS